MSAPARTPHAVLVTAALAAAAVPVTVLASGVRGVQGAMFSTFALRNTDF